ncbi:MAG TPA: CBS domain-containing protein [Candidatus Limnocylindria bacterium]
MKVRDVMTTQVVSVPPGMRLKELARVLSEARIGGAPVVNEVGDLIGVVSEADLVGKQVGRPPSRRTPLDWIFGDGDDAWELRRRAATTVEEAMTAPAVTVTTDRPLREVAAVMVDRGVNRLPVMEDGRLVGIVTRADLVRAYLGRDDAILRAIRDDVIKRRMWLDPDQLQIEVGEGLVHVSGSVDRRSTAALLVKLIGLVDGVDGVESRLTWDFDDRDVEPPADEPEPGAASLAARERPRALHG